MNQNPNFAPLPWSLGVPQSWVVEDSSVRSTGGMDVLSRPIGSLPAGSLVAIHVEVVNPDGSEILICAGSNTIYAGIPSGTIEVVTTLAYPATTLTVKDLTGEGTLKLSNFVVLA